MYIYVYIHIHIYIYIYILYIYIYGGNIQTFWHRKLSINTSYSSKSMRIVYY